jgi:glutathione S-transferase
MEIFHIALASDWEAALASGSYRVSTLGRTLDEEGFVHCSCADQVDGVRSRFYAGVDGLVLLAIDVDRLRSEVRFEDVGDGELFPHVYGPIDVDAVVAVTALSR